MVTIVLNMVFMACNYDNISESKKKILEYANHVFSAIFALECVMKLVVYHKTYFYTTWNKFDFFVVCASIIDILMGVFSSNKTEALTVVPQLARVLRVLRITRVLRLANKNVGL